MKQSTVGLLLALIIIICLIVAALSHPTDLVYCFQDEVLEACRCIRLDPAYIVPV